MGAANEWNPNPPWKDIATSAMHSIRYLAGSDTADPGLRDFPDSKNLVKPHYAASEMKFRATPAPYYVHPFHGRDWVRVWVCADIDLSMTHSFDPNVQPAEEEDDDDEQIYYDWARRSVSGAYIGKTWRAPKKWRPVTNTDEEKAILMESGKVRVEGQSADVHVGSYVQETYNSSSAEEANINSRVEEMTTWVADHMVIPRLNSFRRYTKASLTFKIHSGRSSLGCGHGCRRNLAEAYMDPNTRETPFS